MKSKELFALANELIPGGVSSPVRAYEPFPRYIKRALGSRIYDVDGNEYIDYCMGFGPLILGHSHPFVVQRLSDQLKDGILYGAPIEKEIELAKVVRKLFPSMERVRFTNSGTEATMHAIRLARGYTKREKIITMEGAFHGSHDTVLMKAGSGAATFGVPKSLGIPLDTAKNTIVVPYNDVQSLEKAIREHKEEIAAVLTEPLLANIGPVLPEEGYLQSVRELTRENDILLILDEVITGFRLALGGAQEYYGIRADITTLGKILGGGLPVGAFGGAKEIMEMVAPSGKVYQAGTFSGNPLTMTAGIATLQVMMSQGLTKLNANGQKMREFLMDALERLKLPYRVQGIASMFQVFFTDREVRNYQECMRCNPKLFHRVFLRMLDMGVYLAPSQFETNFLSMAHSYEDIERTVAAFESALRDVKG